METPTIGQTVTVRTKYGSLPGTHHGTVVEAFGPWFVLEVWVGCRGRHERIHFSPQQVVPDNTPVTDMGLAALHRFESEYNAAMAAHPGG